MHNTGEGGLSTYHRSGADLIYQIGTAYFGCRDEQADSTCTGCGRWSSPRRCGRSRRWHGHRDQAESGRQTRSRRSAAGAEGDEEIAEIRGIPRVYNMFAEAGLTDDVTFIGSGKLGLPDNAAAAMALGCDMVNVAREPMFALGCIQAQRCHTDKCPVGVATQDPWLAHGLDVHSKAERVANYVRASPHRASCRPGSAD